MQSFLTPCSYGKLNVCLPNVMVNFLVDKRQSKRALKTAHHSFICMVKEQITEILTFIVMYGSSH
jgi:hypothetical protein